MSTTPRFLHGRDSRRRRQRALLLGCRRGRRSAPRRARLPVARHRRLPRPLDRSARRRAAGRAHVAARAAGQRLVRHRRPPARHGRKRRRSGRCWPGSGGSFDGVAAAGRRAAACGARRTTTSRALVKNIRRVSRRWHRCRPPTSRGPPTSCERAHTELGLIGAVLPLDAFVSLAGARALAPSSRSRRSIAATSSCTAARRAPTFPGQQSRSRRRESVLRPGGAGAGDAAAAATPGDNVSARTLLATATHLATGVITLALTDFLDAYPDVTVQVAMMGGAISYVAEQIQMAAEDAGHAAPAKRFEERLPRHRPERPRSARHRAGREGVRRRSHSLRHRQRPSRDDRPDDRVGEAGRSHRPTRGTDLHLQRAAAARGEEELNADISEFQSSDFSEFRLVQICRVESATCQS